MFTIVAISILIPAETLWRARLNLMHFHILSAHDLCAWLLVTQCDLAGKMNSIALFVCIRCLYPHESPLQSTTKVNVEKPPSILGLLTFNQTLMKCEHAFSMVGRRREKHCYMIFLQTPHPRILKSVSRQARR